MEEEIMDKCKICGNDIDLKNPHFILTFNKEASENGSKKILDSVEGAKICDIWPDVLFTTKSHLS